MRWIFLTLVLLNALFAALEFFESVSGSKAKATSYEVQGEGVRLLLLSDLGLTVAEGKREDAGELCLLAGPLNNGPDARRLVDGLKALNLVAKTIAQPIVKAPNYWVYLQSYENRKAAITMLKSLQRAKIDSYLITQGELANGISLGVFENIDSARRMQERRQGQGYDVKIKELGKKDFEYWVFVEGGYSAVLDTNITKIMEELKMSFGKRQISCKSVASEKKLP